MTRIERKKIAIALGSNLGDRLAFLKKAAALICEDVLEEGALSSRVYETAPWGIEDQPAFLNAVLVGETQWQPPGILSYLKETERAMGRSKSVRNGPREIDLDLIAFDEEVWNREGLEVPHPRLTERDFVLLPLNEIWPGWKHPKTGKTTAQMLEALGNRKPEAAKVFSPSLLDKENR